MTVTSKERAAARETDPSVTTDEDVITLEEMACLYVAQGGKDQRALDLYKAAQDAGKIDKDGNWIADDNGDEDDE